MRALRPGLKSSRQAQMTERGAIGFIDFAFIENWRAIVRSAFLCFLCGKYSANRRKRSGTLRPSSTERIEEWVCYWGGNGTSTLGSWEVAGDLDCACGISPISFYWSWYGRVYNR